MFVGKEDPRDIVFLLCPLGTGDSRFSLWKDALSVSMSREAIPIMKIPSPGDFPCLVVMVLENFPQVLGTVF